MTDPIAQLRELTPEQLEELARLATAERKPAGWQCHNTCLLCGNEWTTSGEGEELIYVNENGRLRHILFTDKEATSDWCTRAEDGRSTFYAHHHANRCRDCKQRLLSMPRERLVDLLLELGPRGIERDVEKQPPGELTEGG